MTGKKKVWFALAGIVTLLLFAGGVSWAWWFKTDPQVEMVRALQAKAFSEESRALEPEERRAIFNRMREESEKLTDEQRRALREEVRESFQGRMQQRIGRFFELSGDERIAYLDEQIDEIEERSAQWRQRERSGEVGGRGPGSGRGGPGGGFGARDGRGRGGRGNMTAEQRNDRRRGFLDRTSAQDRAQFAAYMEAINARREERGLEPMRRFGRR
jgi:hypothetical protein